MYGVMMGNLYDFVANHMDFSTGAGGRRRCGRRLCQTFEDPEGERYGVCVCVCACVCVCVWGGCCVNR